MTSGQVASSARSPRALASARTAGETPCAEKITTAPGGHVAQVVGEDRALAPQVLDHVAVVHDLVAHPDGRAVDLERHVDDVDGAVDAGAEAARRGEVQGAGGRGSCGQVSPAVPRPDQGGPRRERAIARSASPGERGGGIRRPRQSRARRLSAANSARSESGRPGAHREPMSAPIARALLRAGVSSAWARRISMQRRALVVRPRAAPCPAPGAPRPSCGARRTPSRASSSAMSLRPSAS